MLGGKSNPHVPWSRHMGVSKTRAYTDGTFTGTRTLLKKGAILSTGWDSANNQRRASSELNLGNGSYEKESDEDGLDSQSDPGSFSPRNKKWSASRIYVSGNKESEGEHIDYESFQSTKVKKQPIQGRGHPTTQLRRRKRIRDEICNGQNQGNFVVEIPEQMSPNATCNSSTHRSPQYVHTYFEFLYYSCVSPFKWDRKDADEKTRCQRMLHMIQKIVFAYVVIVASFSSFHLIKYFILEFLKKRNLNSFIDIGYFAVSGLFQLYLTYFLLFSQKDISENLQAWEQYELKINDEESSSEIPKLTNWMPIVKGIGTVVMTLLKTVILYDSFEEVITIYSDETAEALLLWTPEQMKNLTAIHNSFGEQINVTKYIAGIFGAMSVFWWNLQMDCVKDLIYWIAKVNERHVMELGRKVESTLKFKLARGKNTEEKDEECWTAYRQMIDVNMFTNDTYSELFLISHLDTFLTFSYFLTQVLNKNATMIDVAILAYDVIKGILAFFPARRASVENEKCRRWIQTLHCQTGRFCVGKTPFTREVMLWELKEDALGLGSGKMHINNEFIVTFITLVASLFCFLLNLEQKEEAVIRY